MVKKWQAALLVAHGEKCVFKRKTDGGNKPNVWVISCCMARVQVRAYRHLPHLPHLPHLRPPT